MGLNFFSPGQLFRGIRAGVEFVNLFWGAVLVGREQWLVGLALGQFYFVKKSHC